MHHGAVMRFSVNLEPELHEALRALAFAERTSLNTIVNRLVRKGLEGSPAHRISSACQSASSRFPVSPGSPGRILTAADVVRAEVEAEAPGRFMLNEGPSS